MNIHAFRVQAQIPSILSGASLTTLLLLWTTAAGLGGVPHAQATPPITPSGLDTQVNLSATQPAGKVQYDITGGTRPGNGPNLFHSFGDFNVPTNNIANFLNETALPTHNILGRVTGGNPSSIFGTIQTMGFASANLFLMNAAGIVFGPNATLNVGGSVTFTTASYLRLAEADGTNAGIFKADPGGTSILTSAPIVAFGFLGSHLAAISVKGSNLSVPTVEAISLVAGNQGFTYTDSDTGNTASAPGGVTMTGGKLSSLGGQINLASVASPGEILFAGLQSAPNIDGQSFTSMGNITLSQGGMLDVSGNSAGTIAIRGGQFVIADATISANTGNANGASTAVDIQVIGEMSISDTRGVPAITARATGTGNAGEVGISSANLDATSTADSLFALIDTHTSGMGKGGDVSIAATGNLTVTGSSSNQMFFIDSGTTGLAGGTGGSVTITAMAGNVQLVSSNINTGDLVAQQTNQDSSGSGGDVMIAADTFQMTNSAIATDAVGAGRAGGISISARDIQLNNFSLLEQLGINSTGELVINAEKLLMSDSAQIVSGTASAPGGGVTITASTVELKNGSTVQSQTFGDGAAGHIRITATDHLTLSDDPNTLGGQTRPSGLFTNSLGGLGNLGDAGAIIVTTPQLRMTGGARIDTTTQTNGHGGDVTITQGNSISISGDRPTPVLETDLFGLGSSRPSGIFTRTVGNNLCPVPCGDAGRIAIDTGSLNLAGGAQINSGTTSTGGGGDIAIRATGPILLSGTLSDGTPSGLFSRTIGTPPGSGAGGNITLTAGQSVTISDGASVSASSSGPGNAGDISINAGQQFEMRNSSVKTEAAQASGGNIDIQAIDQVRLVNSSISTSVLGGAGRGGNITIDPNVVVLQNSNVIAQAVQGAGGNITITTPLFLADSTSLVNASSQFGLNGTVTIQSPTSNLSESLGTLPSEPNQAHSLLTQRCAALANGQASSFVVAGREQFPPDPGSWLTSPLALAALGKSFDAGDAVAAVPAIMPIAVHDTSTVSLRRLTPEGFLIANFADSEATGCHS